MPGDVLSPGPPSPATKRATVLVLGVAALAAAVGAALSYPEYRRWKMLEGTRAIEVNDLPGGQAAVTAPEEVARIVAAARAFMRSWRPARRDSPGASRREHHIKFLAADGSPRFRIWVYEGEDVFIECSLGRFVCPEADWGRFLSVLGPVILSS